MKSSDNSLHDVLQELMRTHANSLEILAKFSEAFTSTTDSVSVNLVDNSGQTTTYQIPSIGYLNSELKRLEENIKGLAGVDTGSATIRLEDGTYKRILASENSKEPSRIGSVTIPNSFTRRNNWFFDNFINPMLVVTFDVTNYVSSDVRSVWYRRIIVNTDTDEKRTIFDQNIKGRNDIDYETLMLFLNGRGINHFVDEDEYRFPPSISQFTGTFDVISILNSDTSSSGNSKIYRLNKLTYTNNLNQVIDTETLKIGDILSTRGGARYRVDELNKIDNTIRLTLTSGYELIPIGTDVLYIYSEVLTLRQVEVSIGHDERQVIFFRPVNNSTQVASTKWSPGAGIYSNELRIRTADSEMSLDDYYRKYCIDFGAYLLDAAKNKPVPTILGIKPDAPLLRADYFKVVIANEHKIQSQDAESLRLKFAEKNRLQSEIQQLELAISKTKEELQKSYLGNPADNRIINNKLKNLIDQKNSLSTLYSTIVREMGAMSTTEIVNESPKYRIRGFFPIPTPKIENKSGAQNIIQFIIQYRYLRLDGTANGSKSFEFTDNTGNNLKGYYSEWVEVLSPVRKQVYDTTTQKYVWANEDVNDADAVNINQVDIPITSNEKVEIRIASISEAGFPLNPLKSDYSQSVIIDFPTELVQANEKSLLQQAQQELNKVEVISELNSQGLDVVLSNVFSLGDKVYVTKGDVVASGFTTDSGTQLSVFEKFRDMESKMLSLQEMVTATKGKMDVYLLDDANNRYTISNGGLLELHAGFYSEIVQQFPENERKGAIVTAKYCIVIENLNSTPLELVTRFPGGINQSIEYLYDKVNKNPEYLNRNYHLASLLHNNVSTDRLSRNSPYWLAPFMSSQVPSQFAYARGKALGLVEDLYKRPNDNRYLIPSEFTQTNINPDAFVWTGVYDTTGKPYGTTNVTDFCVHIDHPDVRSKAFAGTPSQIYEPNVIETTTIPNQVNPKIRHAKYFNLQMSEQDGMVQLGYKDIVDDNIWKQIASSQLTQAQPFQKRANYQDKLGFSPNDRYLIGSKTCGSYLMFAPASTQQLMVNGTDYRSNLLLEQGEDKAIRIPVIFQFRMTDYHGVGSSGTGKVGGFNPSSTIELTNITYGKKIGMDIYVKDEGVYSFDILVKASYARESLTQVVQSPGFIDRTRRAVQDFFKT
jgi:hypothetical protein